MKVIEQDIRIRVERVPEASNGTWGFAKRLTGRDAGNNRAEDVFVHGSELSNAGIYEPLAEGQEFVCDVLETPKGLRASEIRPF